MADFSPASAYQQSAARGASPIGLVVALYDTVLRDFRRAIAALDSGDVESRVFELNHALTVIAHLRDALDHQRGGVAAPQLSRFYQLTHAMILEANISGSRKTILKLLDLYGGLRNEWNQVERQVGSSAAVQPQALATSSAQLPRSVRLDKPGTPPETSHPTGPSGRWSA